MDFLTKNRQEITNINEQVHSLTDFSRENNLYNSFVPRMYGEGQQRRVEPTVNKAIRDNLLIGYAIQNSRQFKLDTTKQSKLQSMYNRNISHQLLNSQRYRKDSPAMQRVKSCVEEVESSIVEPVFQNIAGQNDNEIRRNKAKSLEEYTIKYQNAIIACKEYMKDRSPASPKGFERYSLVLQTMNNMLDEMNRLNFAKQMVFRGAMGQNARTVKDLIMESQGYMHTSGTYTEAEKQNFNSGKVRAKTYYAWNYAIEDAEYGEMQEELRLFYDAIKQNVPADMLVKNYGNSKKDKKYAKNFLISLRDTLSSLHEGDKDCTSFVVGNVVVNLFQKEDGTLDLGYTYINEEGNQTVRQENIGMTAKDLAHKLGINMIENEKVFGKENTGKILLETKNVKDDTPFKNKARSTETAAAYLRTRLGIPNIRLTNIPAKELVKFARQMETGRVSPQAILDKINNYEYGNKRASAQQRANDIAQTQEKLHQLDIDARIDGFEDMKELNRQYRREEKLNDLTRRENEKALKRKQRRDARLAQQQAQQNAQNQNAQNVQNGQNQQNAQVPVNQEQNQQNQNAQNLQNQQNQNQQQVPVNQEQNQQNQNAQNLQNQQNQIQQQVPMNQEQNQQVPVNQEQNQQVPVNQEQIQENQNAQNLQNQQNQIQQQAPVNQEQNQLNQNAPVQQNAPQVQLPEEAVAFEEALNNMEQQYRTAAEDDKTAFTQEHEEKIWLLEHEKRPLVDRLARFTEQKNHEEEDEARYKDRLENAKENYQLNYINTQMEKLDNKKKKLTSDIDKLKKKHADRPELMEEEKAWLVAEYNKAGEDIQKDLEDKFFAYNEIQDRKLTRRTQRIDRRRRKASDALADVERRINEENRQYELKIQGRDTRLQTQLAEVQRQRDSFNKWKYYYTKEKTRQLGNVLNGFQVVDNGGQVHDLENVPLNFAQWKIQLDQDVEKRRQEKQAADLLKERHDRMVEQYRELRGDLKELKESDLPTITDAKVNGEDTLDLMRLRKTYEENGTLKEKIFYSVEYEEEEDARKEREARDARLNAGNLRTAARNDLVAIENEKRSTERELSDNKKKQEELERQKQQLLEPELLRIRQIAPEKLFEGSRMYDRKLSMLEQEKEKARQEFQDECAKIDQRVESNKITREAADARKAELLKLHNEKIRICDSILVLLGDEPEERLDEKLSLSEEFDKAVKDVEDQMAAKTISKKSGREALDRIWKEYENRLKISRDSARQDVKKRNAEDEKRRREYDDKLNELEARRLVLLDEESILSDKKVAQEGEINSKRQVIAQLDEEYNKQTRLIEGYSKSRAERAERQRAEKKPTGWSHDEDKLLGLVSEIIYATATWEMDNGQGEEKRLFGILEKYATDIGVWLAHPEETKAKINAFADKLPLKAFGIDKEFITDDVYDWIDKSTGFINTELERKKNEARTRETARDVRRTQKRAEIEQRKQQRDAQMAQSREVLDDLAEEEADRLEAEKDADEAIKQSEIYNKEHELDAISELQEKIDKEVADKLKEQKKQVEAVKAKVSIFFNWFKNLAADDEEDKQEEKKEEKKEEVKAESEAEKRARLREERRLLREARKAERERLNALQEQEWEKEIEEAAKDDDYEADQKLLTLNDQTLITFGLSEYLKTIEDPGQNQNIRNLYEEQKKMEQKLHKFLRDSQDKFAKFINKNLGGTGREEPIEQVPYYRENNIDAAERKNRVDLGKEQLGKMIRNSMKGQEGEGQFVRNVLAQYMGKSNMLDVRSMLAGAIRNAKPSNIPENATEEEKLRAVAPMLGGLFKGAGPLLQKILQGMPDSMIPKGLESAFEDTKSNLSPIPRPIVEAQLLSMVERSDGRIKKIEVVRSLGAASVGQAFLCTIYTKESKEEVVIKLLRPDVRNRMLREKKIMENCASQVGKGMEKTYQGILTRYLEELDLTIEARNTELGRIYDIGNDISSMKVSSLANPTPNSMVVTRAPGDTVVNVLKESRQHRDDLLGKFYKKGEDGQLIMEGENPKLFVDNGADVQQIAADLSKRLTTLMSQQEKLCDFATKWVDEAVFGEGYYHGDLHAGNIMMSDKKLTVIDFGNATKLDPFQQEKITHMLMAAAAGSGSGFYDGFTALLGEESLKLLETKKDELKAVFGEVMKLGDYHSSAERIAAALVRAQKLGFELPPAIYGFQQCQIRLQNTIDSFNSEIKEIQKIITTLQQAERNAILDVKNRYDRTSGLKADYARKMKIALLSDKEEDLRPLLQSRDKNTREKLKNMLQGDFTAINEAMENNPKSLSDAYLGTLEIADTFYGHFAGKIHEKAAWDQVFTNHGFNLANDGRTRQQKSEQFAHHAEQLGDEQKEALINDLKALLRPYDILGALKALWTAQDEGKGEDELRSLENEAIKRIQDARTRYLGKLEADNEKRIQDNFINEEDRQAERNKVSPYYNKDKLLAPIRQKLLNRETIPQAEKELKPLFADPIYGQKLQTAFEAYKNAPADAPNLEELLDNLLEAYRMPVLMTFGDTSRANKMYRVDMDEPNSFVEVMSDVINRKWFTALRRVNLFKSIKYGVRIEGDIQGTNLSFTEIMKIVWKIIKKE